MYHKAGRLCPCPQIGSHKDCLSFIMLLLHIPIRAHTIPRIIRDIHLWHLMIPITSLIFFLGFVVFLLIHPQIPGEIILSSVRTNSFHNFFISATRLLNSSNCSELIVFLCFKFQMPPSPGTIKIFINFETNMADVSVISAEIYLKSTGGTSRNSSLNFINSLLL